MAHICLQISSRVPAASCTPAPAKPQAKNPNLAVQKKTPCKNPQARSLGTMEGAWMGAGGSHGCWGLPWVLGTCDLPGSSTADVPKP